MVDTWTPTALSIEIKGFPIECSSTRSKLRESCENGSRCAQGTVVKSSW